MLANEVELAMVLTLDLVQAVRGEGFSEGLEGESSCGADCQGTEWGEEED